MSTKELLAKLTKELDGLESRLSVDDEAMHAMSELYALIWTEACYDPNSEESGKYANRLLPHIRVLNGKFHFKR